MCATLWLVVGLVCAPGFPSSGGFDKPERVVENVPPPKPAASKITAVTVYQGQALVTREVSVPEGEGTVELVVTSVAR